MHGVAAAVKAAPGFAGSLFNGGSEGIFGGQTALFSLKLSELNGGLDFGSLGAEACALRLAVFSAASTPR
jgi:hypothetical protein